MSYIQCGDCAYWKPFNLDENGQPVRRPPLHFGRCHLQLPPYLMRRQLPDFNTNPDEGCDLGKEKTDADPQV